MDIRQLDDTATMPSLAEVLQIDADATMHGDTAVRAPARLLEFDWKRYVALPIHTTLEIVERPEIIPVPGAPYYGLGMLRWQGRFLAVLNLCALLNAYPKAGAPSPRHALVVAYQTAPRKPIGYAAISTISLPEAVQVSDDMQCALPQDSDLWPLISLSCFSHRGVPVPVIHTGGLFESAWG